MAVISGRQQSAKRLIDMVGHTPLLHLPSLTEGLLHVAVYAKAEWFNPSGSVKARAARAMIADAKASGRLKPGTRLLDASSGNTALAYAMIAAAEGYAFTLCVPRNVSRMVSQRLRMHGVEVVLTDPLEGSDGAIQEARRLADQNPDWLYLDQYNNPANWRAHYQTTAEEIWQQTAGEVTHFVAGVGTSGTFTGTTRRLRELNPHLYAVAVEPDDALHGLEGLKYMHSAIVPGIYDAHLPDETQFVATEKAYAMVQDLARYEGLFVGPSSGAACVVAKQLAERLSAQELTHRATIVTVLPDAGDRYLREGLIE
jgi:cysteine synthase B